MEKRTFLAILLSILVLFFYNRFYLGQNKVVSSHDPSSFVSDTTQAVERKQVKAIPVETAKKKSTVNAEEKITFIETETYKTEFSNIGGNLKSITINKYNEKMPLDIIFGLSQYETYPFSLKSVFNDKVVFVYRDDEFEIQKIYDLSKQDFVIDLEISVKNISKMSKVKSLKIEGLGLGTKEIAKNKANAREYGLYEYAVMLNEKITRKNNAVKFSSKNALYEIGQVGWISFRNRYFCAIIKPTFPTKDYESDPVNENQLNLIFQTDNKTLAPGEQVSYKAYAFVGPQSMTLLKEANIGAEEVLVFSKFWLLNSISRFVINTMKVVYRFVPNWGFCIIFVSFAFYLVTYPLTIKSMTSMKKMQSLQPEITRIREQYKSNPQRLNKEVMELYKENSVNPLGGCLPMLLQMPIFIALYQALWRTVAFKGAHFLWIKDLSEPDRFMILPFSLPIIGNEFNILPFLMMIAMFFQQKLSSKSMATTDPNQVMQQKMMMFFFPVFLGFIFYKFASGLTLYFTMFYILSTFTQWKMSKLKMVR